LINLVPAIAVKLLKKLNLINLNVKLINILNNAKIQNIKDLFFVRGSVEEFPYCQIHSFDCFEEFSDSSEILVDIFLYGLVNIICTDFVLLALIRHL